MDMIPVDPGGNLSGWEAKIKDELVKILEMSLEADGRGPTHYQQCAYQHPDGPVMNKPIGQWVQAMLAALALEPLLDDGTQPGFAWEWTSNRWSQWDDTTEREAECTDQRWPVADQAATPADCSLSASIHGVRDAFPPSGAVVVDTNLGTSGGNTGLNHEVDGTIPALSNKIGHHHWPFGQHPAVPDIDEVLHLLAQGFQNTFNDAWNPGGHFEEEYEYSHLCDVAIIAALMLRRNDFGTYSSAVLNHESILLNQRDILTGTNAADAHRWIAASFMGGRYPNTGDTCGSAGCIDGRVSPLMYRLASDANDGASQWALELIRGANAYDEDTLNQNNVTSYGHWASYKTLFCLFYDETLTAQMPRVWSYQTSDQVNRSTPNDNRWRLGASKTVGNAFVNHVPANGGVFLLHNSPRAHAPTDRVWFSY